MWGHDTFFRETLVLRGICFTPLILVKAQNIIKVQEEYELVGYYSKSIKAGEKIGDGYMNQQLYTRMYMFYYIHLH